VRRTLAHEFGACVGQFYSRAHLRLSCRGCHQGCGNDSCRANPKVHRPYWHVSVQFSSLDNSIGTTRFRKSASGPENDFVARRNVSRAKLGRNNSKSLVTPVCCRRNRCVTGKTCGGVTGYNPRTFE
jgi:hypothetical protein